MIVPITSFKGGYWSERLSGRFELAGYGTAASKLENWLPLIQGGIAFRPGTKHCGYAKTSTGAGLLVPFIINNAVAYVLEFGNLYVRFWKNGSLLRSGSTAVEFATPYTAAILNDLRYAQNGDTLVVVHRDYAPTDIKWVGGDTFSYGSHAYIGPQWTASAAVSIGDVRYNAGNLYYYTQAGTTGTTGPTSTVQFNNLEDKSDRITDGTAQCRWLQTMPFRAAGDYPGCVASFASRLWFASTYNKPQTVWATTTYEPTDFRQFEVINYTNRQMADAETYYFSASAGDARTLMSLTVDPRQFCKVGQYLYGTTLDSVSLVSPGTKVVSMTDTTVTVDTDMVLGKGSQCYTISNWVTPTTPEYENVTIIKDVIGDSDGLEFEISTGDADRIVDITAAKCLLIRTATDELTVSSNVTPLSISVDIQSRRGSCPLKSIFFNNRPLFVQGDRRHIREFTYNNDSGSYDSSDITFFASDITETGIVSWDYAQTPDPALYCVLADGTLAVLLYDSIYQVQAWTKYTTGNVVSLAVIPGDESDDVYLLVDRGGVRRVERFDKLENGYHLDDGISLVKGTTATIDNAPVLWSGSTITGLTWLAGKAARIVFDGAIYDISVSAGGVATVPAGVTGTALSIGLAYSATGRTMRLTYSGQTGVMQGQIQKIASIVLRLISSYSFTVGSDDEEPVPITGPFTGNQECPLPDGWSRDGWIQFQQNGSLPVVITGIMANTGDA